MGRIDVGAHALRKDLQPVESERHRVHTAMHAEDEFGPFREFGLPRAEAAFVLLRHGGQQARHVLRYTQGRRNADQRCDRIALVRHGTRSTAPGRVRLGKLSDLALRKQRDVARDLAHAAGQQAEITGEADPGLALRMPWRRRGQPKIAGHVLHDRVGVVAELLERPGGAAELQAQGRNARQGEPLAAVVQRPYPASALPAERGDRRLLHQGSSQHGRRCVHLREPRRRADQTLEIGVDERERTARKDHHRRVEDILAGGARVHVARCRGVEERNVVAQRRDQRNGEAARVPAGTRDLRDVEDFRLATARDRARRVAGMTPTAALARARPAWKSSIACTIAVSL